MSYLGQEIGKLGFGLMRLPKIDEKTIDVEQVKEMVDLFMDAGFTYFDTAWAYDGSEDAIRQALVERYPRDSFQLATKNAAWIECKTREDAIGQFERSLKLTGAGYFDYYLLHNLGKTRTKVFDDFDMWNYLEDRKKEGLIKHLGFSFHSTPEELDAILTQHPEMEFVQLQLNYGDWESDIVQSRRCYEVARKHDIPIIVMEPVKGGSLVNLPPEADRIFRGLGGGSNASYAVRFAASFPKMAMVLSGMSDMAQMQDNIGSMKDFEPLSAAETDAVVKVCGIFKKLDLIPCTSCRYCVEENECPQSIRIPDMFSSLNAHEAFHNWNTKFYYRTVITGGDNGKASDCIECGMCEDVCPQYLPIRDLLKDVAKTFES